MSDTPNYGKVLYEPCCEPDDIRNKIHHLKEKLDSAYPDGKAF